MVVVSVLFAAFLSTDGCTVRVVGCIVKASQRRRFLVVHVHAGGTARRGRRRRRFGVILLSSLKLNEGYRRFLVGATVLSEVMGVEKGLLDTRPRLVTAVQPFAGFLGYGGWFVLAVEGLTFAVVGEYSRCVCPPPGIG